MTDAAPICPVCEEAELKPSRYQGELNYGGQTLAVPELECWDCPGCGADAVFPDQARRNHRRYQDARRQTDDLLTGSEIERLRKQMGLTQLQAAELFGGGQNAFSKYERGDVIQSRGMDNSMRLAALEKKNLDYLKKRAGWEIESSDTTRIVTHKRTTVVPFPGPVAAVSDYQDGSETHWYTEQKQG